MRRMKANRCRDLFGGLLVAMLAVLILSPLCGPAAYRAYDRHLSSLGYGTKAPIPLKEAFRIVSEAEARAAARGEPPVWPAKGQWRTSSDFLRSILPRNLRKRVVDAGAGKTCCLLAGARDDDDNLPVIWTSNFRIGLDDLLSADPESEASWADRLVPAPFHGTNQVVLVRKSGSFQVIKARDLTAAAFLGGAAIRHPDDPEILSP